MLTTQNEATKLDLVRIRAQFPSLAQTVNGHPATFLDGPGGTQVPQRVIDAISHYLSRENANSGGNYETARRTDKMLLDARHAMADFLGCDWDEIVFGMNMTSLTFAMSRSIGRELKAGDEIVLTCLDHDANFAPWKALEERGVVIRVADIHEDDCTLDMADLASKINSRTKVVAVGLASNAVGTINDVAEVVRLAHAVGALVYIDAVHYAAHGPIDARAMDCDFLACSSYKFFGPHMGVLYGKREHLQRLTPYKVRPLINDVPYRWEMGTLNHECIAGITECVNYLADLGRAVAVSASTRRQALLAGMREIQLYERALVERMIQGLLEIPGLKVYGITDPRQFEHRCPTVAARIDGHTPADLANKLNDRGIFAWDGNYYAINLSERLRAENSGGFLRIGLAHYNVREEVETLLEALQEIVGRK
jgi:cysteine desulfurase family protein (TIGR01976 family)